MSHERVSGFPEKAADLWEVRGISGKSGPNFRGSLGKLSGSEKGVFWKRGLLREVHFLDILENLEILEVFENPQTLANKGESDYFREILENLEILEILEISPVKKTPS